MAGDAPDILRIDPVPTLVGRLRNEAAYAFPAETPATVARAPGRLDVMGGIADYTGSLVLEMPLAVAAAAAAVPRTDGVVEALSLNLLDDHKPFQFRLPAASLTRPYADLQRDFVTPGREWAAYLVGTLAVLVTEGYLPAERVANGVSLGVYSTVPSGGGVSSSAAVEVATMNALVALFGIDALRDDPVRLAALCQKAENNVVGAPCGVMDQVASHMGHAGTLLRMRCQPHDVLDPLPLPPGVKVVGVNTNIKHSVGGGAYGRTRAAAFMGHTLILDAMRHKAAASGRRLRGDPTQGYLANLPADDYKALFRPSLPEAVTGREFLQQHATHGDPATTVDPDAVYRVQAACDHHVLEAGRVPRFAGFLEDAARATGAARGRALRSAGHLMYASHKSYGDNANLGAAECDVLVELVKAREAAGLYGAKITGGGSGGTVAVLLDDSPRAADALADVLDAYHRRTRRRGGLLDGTSPGAHHAGTATF